MSANNSRPSFGRRLWRALIGLLAIATFLIILGGIGAAGYFGLLEFQRMTTRIEAAESQLDAANGRSELLRSDVNNLMEDSPSQVEIARLQATIESLEAELSLLQTDITGDIDSQQTVLNSLAETVNGNLDLYGSLEANLNTLNEALGAIQGDVIDNSSQIDALGGEVDSVQTAVTDLGTEMIAMEEQQVAMIEESSGANALQAPLALFRVWELITRARLRLLEDNIGLATEDIDLAIQTIDALIALENSPFDPQKLEMVQTRLALAFLSLPDSPSMAATDLESAWDELDAIFTEQFLGGMVPDTEVESEPVATPAATETAVATEQPANPTATPLPEPTATP